MISILDMKDLTSIDPAYRGDYWSIFEYTDAILPELGCGPLYSTHMEYEGVLCIMIL